MLSLLSLLELSPDSTWAFASMFLTLIQDERRSDEFTIDPIGSCM